MNQRRGCGSSSKREDYLYKGYVSKWSDELYRVEHTDKNKVTLSNGKEYKSCHLQVVEGVESEEEDGEEPVQKKQKVNKVARK